MELHDDFNNDEPDGTKWREIYGGDTSDMCGHLVSGNALVFHKVWSNMIRVQWELKDCRTLLSSVYLALTHMYKYLIISKCD